jgi:hypothetical protein
MCNGCPKSIKEFRYDGNITRKINCKCDCKNLDENMATYTTINGGRVIGYSCKKCKHPVFIIEKNNIRYRVPFKHFSKPYEKIEFFQEKYWTIDS